MTTTDRHHGRHVVLYGRDYRWQHTDGQWTLRDETPDERVQRIHQLLGVVETHGSDGQR